MVEWFSFRNWSPCGHWLLLPILVAAALLRLWQINESLWLDELHSAWVVSAGVSQVAERAQIGNQSPLYFYLPWASTSLLGMSEWSLRLPSLAAGVGVVAMAYGLAYRLTHSRAAASACSMLAALDHNFLFYATETRPYAWVQLLAAVQLYVFVQLRDGSPRRRRIAFVVCSALLFYLHYTAILLVAGEVIFVLVQSSLRRRQDTAVAYTTRKLAIDLLCLAALTIPVAAHLADIGARRNAWTSFIDDTSVLLAAHWFSLASYVVVPVIVCLIIGCMQAAVMLRRDKPVMWGSVLGNTSDAVDIAAPPGSIRASVTAVLQNAFLLACWLGVPLAIVWLLTVTDIARLYLGRYVIGAALAPILFAGLCIGLWRSRRLQAVVAGITIAAAILRGGMPEQLQRDGRLFGDRRENWSDAVEYVNDNRALAGPVFVRSGLLEADRLASDPSQLLREYCVSPVTSIYPIARPPDGIRPLTTSNTGALTEDDVRLIAAAGGAWFIINGTAGLRERCSERVLAALSKQLLSEAPPAIHGGLVLEERQFEHVGVFFVTAYSIDDQVQQLDAQPTSPSSIAPP